eukprot:scaffold1254_cov251-Pinguiococcus_pyrenoidosus.AAC.8
METPKAVGLGVILGASLGLVLASLRRRSEDLDAEEPEDAPSSSGEAVAGHRERLPRGLKLEFFARSVSYFNEDGVDASQGGFGALQDSFVVVVGLGGVGSHAAHMLARCGVGRLRLIDFDQVTLSSLNRHATATLADVGRPKSLALQEALEERVPTCETHSVNRMFTAAAADDLLCGWRCGDESDERSTAPDLVLDCIDDLNTKAELLASCRDKGLRVLSSMGAGGKADPSRVRIGELMDCIKDPIASKLRWKLRKLDPHPDPNRKDRMSEGVTCVYSCEKTKRGLLPLTEEQKQAPKEFGTVENFRLRVVPVLGTMPAIMGQAMASYVLSELGLRPFEPVAVEGALSMNVKNKLLSSLTNQESRVFYGGDRNQCVKNIGIGNSDVEYLVSEVWRGKSPISGTKFIARTTFTLMRWRRDGPCDASNIILCTVREAEDYNRGLDANLSPEEIFGAELVSFIDARLAFMSERTW